MRTSRVLHTFVVALSVFAAATPTRLAAQSSSMQKTSSRGSPATVILVRHAEKATTGGSDPSLSEAGQSRAKALAAAIADAHVTAIITTTFKRTFETAEPFGEARGVVIEKVAITGDAAAHLAAVTAAIRKHPGEVVLVVGHSNTVPSLVHALGGPKLPDLCDASYSTLFTVVPGKGSAPASVVRSRYGAPDPDGADTCTTPMR